MSIKHGKTLDAIIRTIAKEHDLKIPQVEHIIDSQFRFIHELIESEDSKTVSIIYLGKFTPNGIKEAKLKGEYKRGKFIKPNKGDNSGVLAPTNIQEQQD